MQNNYFHNKIVLVSGAGAGIGRELCVQLVAAGAIVFCTDIDLAKAAETAHLCEKNAVALTLDVTRLSEFENQISDIVKTHGRLDLIFNNAGMALSGEMRDIAIDDWKKVIDINFYGVLYGSQTAYKQMLKQGYGQIVNSASIFGLVDNLVLMGPYTVTKHAVVEYTRTLSAEAKNLGVKVNVVCLGFIKTSVGQNTSIINAAPTWGNKVNALVASGMSIDRAVRNILSRVSSNKKVIVFPFHVKAELLISKLFPGLVKIIMQYILKRFRTVHRVN